VNDSRAGRVRNRLLPSASGSGPAGGDVGARQRVDVLTDGVAALVADQVDLGPSPGAASSHCARVEQGIPDVAQRSHWDSEYARSIGLPDAYDYGMMRDCWLSHFLTDWIGDEGRRESMSSQMRKFNYMGDTHTFTGEVVGKRVEGDRYLVDVELRGTSQRGEVTCPATATISLPSRETGLAVLPTAPVELERVAAKMLERSGELRAEKRQFAKA
jgi:hypothetical protein